MKLYNVFAVLCCWFGSKKKTAQEVKIQKFSGRQ